MSFQLFYYISEYIFLFVLNNMSILIEFFLNEKRIIKLIKIIIIWFLGVVI